MVAFSVGGDGVRRSPKLPAQSAHVVCRAAIVIVVTQLNWRRTRLESQTTRGSELIWDADRSGLRYPSDLIGELRDRFASASGQQCAFYVGFRG